MTRTEYNLATGQTVTIPCESYALPDGSVVIIDQGETVPAGAVLASTLPPPKHAVPKVVSKFQAYAALTNAGLFAKADAAAKAAGGIPLLAWQTATEFYRDSPTISGIGQSLGLSDSQIDDLFIAAGGIKA